MSVYIAAQLVPVMTKAALMITGLLQAGSQNTPLKHEHAQAHRPAASMAAMAGCGSMQQLHSTVLAPTQ